MGSNPNTILTARANNFIKKVEGYENTDIEGIFALGKTDRNEFLKDLNAVLGRQIFMNTQKLDVEFLRWFFKDEFKYGEYEEFRQTLDARRGEYSDLLDVNDHFKTKTKNFYAQTIFKDVYDNSISANIIKNAFLSAQGFNTYIDKYMEAISKSVKITWIQRQIDLYQTIPQIVKIDLTKGVDEIINKIYGTLQKMNMVSNKFNEDKILQKGDNIVMVGNSKITRMIDFDANAKMFNFGGMKYSAVLKEMVVYDFTDNETLGVMLDGQYSFWIDTRLNETSEQSWARTLISDKFLHQWMRVIRNSMANSVRFVDASKTIGDKIDFRKSPMSLQREDGSIIKDEPTIVDLTEFVIGDTLDRVETNVDIRSVLKFHGIDVESATEENIKNALMGANLKLNKDFIKVININEANKTALVIPSENSPYVLPMNWVGVNINFRINASKKEVKEEVK